MDSTLLVRLYTPNTKIVLNLNSLCHTCQMLNRYVECQDDLELM